MVVELRRRPVGLGQRDVYADRLVDGDGRERHAGPLDQPCEQLALRAAQWRDRPHVMTVAVQCPRHVDALAAGLHRRAGDPLHLAPQQPVDLDRAVEAGIRRAGDDHGSITTLMLVPLSTALMASWTRSSGRRSVISSSSRTAPLPIISSACLLCSGVDPAGPAIVSSV